MCQMLKAIIKNLTNLDMAVYVHIYIIHNGYCLHPMCTTKAYSFHPTTCLRHSPGLVNHEAALRSPLERLAPRKRITR